MVLRVQRYVNDIKTIIQKTEVYGRELGIIGKYLKMNIKINIRNYLDMMHDRRGFSQEELIIIIKEFDDFLDYELLEEYCGEIDSLRNLKDVNIEDDIKDIQDIQDIQDIKNIHDIDNIF